MCENKKNTEEIWGLGDLKCKETVREKEKVYDLVVRREQHLHPSPHNLMEVSVNSLRQAEWFTVRNSDILIMPTNQSEARRLPCGVLTRSSFPLTPEPPSLPLVSCRWAQVVQLPHRPRDSHHVWAHMYMNMYVRP